MTWNLYPEPEHKRQMAESIGSFDPHQAGRWLGSAAAQEAGRTDEYNAAVESWKAAEPHPKDFATPEAQAEVEACVAEWTAKAQAEFNSTLGRLLNRP